MKPLRFTGSSKDDLAAFPNEAKGLAGNELWQVQLGLETDAERGRRCL